MIDLTTEYEDVADRFAFVGFHNYQISTTEALEARLARLQERFWDDRPLPFPVLLDNTDETFETWGVDMFPTFVHIDPAGTVHACRGVDEIRTVLESLRGATADDGEADGPDETDDADGQ